MIIEFGNKGRKERRKKERKLSMKEWNITMNRGQKKSPPRILMEQYKEGDK